MAILSLLKVRHFRMLLAVIRPGSPQAKLGLDPRLKDRVGGERMKAKALKDSSHLYEVERRARHGERPGFWIAELQISPSQKVPWHYHNKIKDTPYVLAGDFRHFLRDRTEEVRRKPGESYSVRPRRPHPVTTAG